MKDMQKLLCWRWGQLPPPSATPSKKRGLGLGSLGLCFYFYLNFLTNALKVVHYFMVGKTDYFDSKTFKKRGALGIFYQTFSRVVLQTINFNNQPSRGTIKIGYEIPNGALPQPSFRAQPQTLIPQLFLRFGHLKPQFLRSSSQFFVVLETLHPNILNPFPHQTPSLLRGSPKAGGVRRSSLP